MPQKGKAGVEAGAVKRASTAAGDGKSLAGCWQTVWGSLGVPCGFLVASLWVCCGFLVGFLVGFFGPLERFGRFLAEVMVHRILECFVLGPVFWTTTEPLLNH